MRKTLPLLLTATTLSACQTVRTDGVDETTAKDVSTELTMPSLECAEGESALLYSFVGSKPHTKDETRLTGDFEMTPSSGHYLSATRFDMCMDAAGEHITLKRIVQAAGTIGLGRSQYRVYTPESQEPNPGLLKAIAANDYSQLEIKIANPEAPGRIYFVKGWVDRDGQGFMTMSNSSAASPLDVPVIHEEWVITRRASRTATSSKATCSTTASTTTTASSRVPTSRSSSSTT
jgi:hypothetical protein